MARRITTLLSLLALCAAVSPLFAGTLEGRWRLVEQTRGEGKANLADFAHPVFLEFERDGGRLSATTWIESGRRHPWPALLEADGTTVHVHEVVVSEDANHVVARYRTESGPAGPSALEFVEEYRVSEDGDRLEGTVTVSYASAESAPDGAWVLRRRFERVR